jgi:hypothetical protein
MPDPIPIVSKTYTTGNVEAPFTLADDEVYHRVSTDDVDRSREVVCADGIMFDRFLATNPVVTYDHSDENPEAYLLAIGRSKRLTLSADKRELLSLTQFDFEDPFAKRAGGQCKRGFLNAWSIRFRPIDFGPPTTEELRRRPDWSRAKTVYRKVELVSFSLVLLPDNPYAVTIRKALNMDTAESLVAKKAETEKPKDDMDGDDAGEPMGGDELAAKFPEGTHTKIHKSMGGGCGVVKQMYVKGLHAAPNGTRMDASHDEPVFEVSQHDADHKEYGETKCMRGKCMKMFEEPTADDDGDEDETIAAEGTAEAAGEKKPETAKKKGMGPMVESVGAEGGYVPSKEEPTKSMDDMGDADMAERMPRAGTHVKFDTGMVRGVGKVVSVHKGEMVPDVEEDVMGTHEDPGMKVKVWKPHGDGHKETSMMIGCRMSECTKCEMLKPPSKPMAMPEKIKPKPQADAPITKTYAFKPLSTEEQERRAAAWLLTPAGKKYAADQIAELRAKRRGAI